jgi:hypothetical protein
LNDEEFEMITVTVPSYSKELYTEIMLVLDSRQSVNATRDRLTFYFRAKGAVVTEPTAAKSQIFIGSGL